MANTKLKTVTIAPGLDVSQVETLLNNTIAAEEANGFDLDKAVEFQAVPAPGGALNLFALLAFVPSSEGSGRGALVKLFEPTSLDTLEDDIQAVIDAEEDPSGELYLVGQRPVTVGRGPDATYAVCLTFGLNPATEAGTGTKADSNKTISGGVLTENGGGSTIANYNFDVSAAVLILSSLTRNIAGVTGSNLLSNPDAIGLDGGAPVALTADGKTLLVTLGALVDSGTPKFVYVFGAEANDGSEVLPAKSLVADALDTKYGANWDNQTGLLLDVVKIQRVAVDTIVVTASSALTGAIKDVIVQLQNTTQGVITSGDIPTP